MRPRLNVRLSATATLTLAPVSHYECGGGALMGYPYRILCVSAVIVGILLCGSQQEAAAGDDEYTRATLRGLKGVYVLVEPLRAETERAGLTKAQIQTDVELRLRKAGIRVLSEKERDETPGSPYLYVNVQVVETNVPLYAFSIDVALMQRVLLERDPKIRSLAETWDTASTGMVREDTLRKFPRDSLADKVDAFINAYLTENPK
jgi:hypothetical protein